MATVFLEGFDKYGPGDIITPAAATSLAQGGWSMSGNGFGTPSDEVSIVAGLSSSGSAVKLAPTSGLSAPAVFMTRTLKTNYSRLIGGFRFSINYPTNQGLAGCVFVDNSTPQCSILVHPVSGFIYIAQGNNGAVLQTSIASVAYNTTHYLEFDITFNSGAFGGWTVWLDGAQIMSGTGTTRQSANNFANVFQYSVTATAAGSGIATATFDDMYLFDGTTAFNNSVLLSNPNIITQYGLSDSQTQFTNNGNVFGNTYSIDASVYSDSANSLYLAAFQPNVNCTINSVVFMPLTNSPTANFRGVIYADSSGAPGTLLSSGTQTTGIVAGTLLNLPLITPQALTAGTKYWLGFINDTTINTRIFDGGIFGFRANNTYGSGAPSSAPTMTPNQSSLLLYGACTGAVTNWESEALNPPLGDVSSVFSNVTNTEDLYNFPVVPSTVTAIYSIGVIGNSKLNAAGAHTIDLVTVSNTTPSFGSNPNQVQTVDYTWYDSYFDVDPHTNIAWTIVAANAATHGMKIVS